jgi:hypothetical protein
MGVRPDASKDFAYNNQNRNQSGLPAARQSLQGKCYTEAATSARVEALMGGALDLVRRFRE